MAWFKVDDKAHSNNKIRRVLAEDPAALGLWTVAGSWSSDNTTDGFVPDHQLPWLLPARSTELAQVLVNARLWRRVRGGHQFHEWDADSDGTKRNPTASELRELREKKAEAGRKGGINSGKARASSGNEQKDSGLDEKVSANEAASKGRRAKHGGAREETPETGTTTSRQGASGSKNEARASADASARADHLVELPTHPIPALVQKTSSSVGAKRATRIPDDWTPSPDLVAWAQKECPNVDGRYETQQFVDYWRAKSGKDATKLDWDLTFQTWFRRANKDAAGKPQRANNRLVGADTRSGATDWNDPKNLEF